jgi:hypothetical protein
MHVVRCHLPNASDRINGVLFLRSPCGTHVLSERLPRAVAEQFSGIHGFEIENVDPDEPEELISAADQNTACKEAYDQGFLDGVKAGRVAMASEYEARIASADPALSTESTDGGSNPPLFQPGDAPRYRGKPGPKPKAAEAA